MILQRSYLQTEVETLHSQNTVLRERVRKIGEIEAYVQILLQNNKKYQEDIKNLQLENNKLRGKVDQVLEQTILLKEAHSREVSQIRSGFESDIEKLIRELKAILQDKQQMQNANNSLIEQLTTRCRKDLQSKKRQIQQLEIQSTRKVNKLAESVKSKERVIEEITWQFKEKQKALIEEIDRLTHEGNLLNKDKEQLLRQINALGQEKRNLIKKNKQLQKQNEDISTKFLKNDQEKSEAMLQIKNKNSDLIQINDQLEQKIRVQEKIINEQGRKINHLIKQSDDIGNVKNEIEASLRRNLRAYEDLKAEHSEVVSKLDYVSKTSQAELRKQAQQLEKLNEDNKKLTRENIELNSESKDKISEIEDLIRAIQKLERKIGDLNEKCLSLQDQNSKRNAENKTLEERLEDALLEKKSLNQKLNLYSSHNATLQEMLEKEKRKNICLETSRFQIQSIAMGALSKPQQICSQYERQIEKMVQQFVAEKKQLQITHSSEIMKLKSAYEEALKEKQDYFNRKISFLEKQMIALRGMR